MAALKLTGILTLFITNLDLIMAFLLVWYHDYSGGGLGPENQADLGKSSLYTEQFWGL